MSILNEKLRWVIGSTGVDGSVLKSALAAWPDTIRESFLSTVRITATRDHVIDFSIEDRIEPPRESWRLFGMSHAAMAA